MAKKADGFFQGVFALARTQLQGLLAAKLIAGGLAVVTLVCVVVASFMRDDLGAGIVWGIALLAFLELLAVFGLGLWAYLREAAAARRVYRVPPDNLERLREIHRPWHRTMGLALKIGEQLLQGTGRAASTLLDKYFLSSCRTIVDDLNRDMQRDYLPESQLASLTQRFGDVLTTTYRDLTVWIVDGDSWSSVRTSADYLKLYNDHMVGIAALEQVEARKDIGKLATVANTLRQLLPPP